MDFSDIFMILLFLISLWFLQSSVKNTLRDIQRYQRCSVKTTAQVLSWKTEEDSDGPTMYIPTIQYSYHGRSFETQWLEGAVTAYQKDRYYSDDSMTLWLNPEDPTVIAVGNKTYRIIESIGLRLFLIFFSLVFILAAVMYFL